MWNLHKYLISTQLCWNSLLVLQQSLSLLLIKHSSNMSYYWTCSPGYHSNAVLKVCSTEFIADTSMDCWYTANRWHTDDRRRSLARYCSATGSVTVRRWRLSVLRRWRLTTSRLHGSHSTAHWRSVTRDGSPIPWYSASAAVSPSGYGFFVNDVATLRLRAQTRALPIHTIYSTM